MIIRLEQENVKPRLKEGKKRIIREALWNIGVKN